MPESPELRLAVLGSPISHSKSPKLHAAAYRALGLDWGYEAIELDAAQLGDFVAGLDASWRGLSLTMPHKHVVLSLLDDRDPLVDLVGAANTLLLADGARRGFNTDVEGIVRAFADHEVTALDTVEILGAGATAQSALAAAAQLGARAARVVVRDLARAESLIPLAERLGIELTRERFGDPRGSLSPDAVISTLPGILAEGEEPLYKPITVGEHIAAKLRGSRDLVNNTDDTEREATRVLSASAG